MDRSAFEDATPDALNDTIPDALGILLGLFFAHRKGKPYADTV